MPPEIEERLEKVRKLLDLSYQGAVGSVAIFHLDNAIAEIEDLVYRNPPLTEEVSEEDFGE